MLKLKQKIGFITIMVIALLAIDYRFNPNAIAIAGTDTYNSFAELSDVEKYGVDYAIESKDTGSTTAVIAIHGGGIEKGTTELAKAVSQSGDYKYYSFIGLKKSGNRILHITATNFDEPTATALVAESESTVSIHGYSGTDKVTYIGGLDTDLGRIIEANLVAAGFDVRPATADIAGTSQNNITNCNLSGKGVQLELTRGLRDSFFTKSGRTSSTLEEYAAAVNKAIQDYNSN